MRVVINDSVGGFRLSEAGILEYCKNKGWATRIFRELSPLHNVAANGNIVYSREIERHDPALVVAVEKLGRSADGPNSHLKIVDIPDGVEYIICDDDSGVEWIAEKHRTWD